MAPKAKPTGKTSAADEPQTSQQVSDEAVRTGPKLTWSAPVTCLTPAAPRCDQVATIRDGKLWVVGGWGGLRGVLPNHAAVQSYDFIAGSWSTLAVSSEGAHPGLAHCAGAYVEGHGLVLTGGWNGKARTNATSVLSLDTGKWQTVTTVGDRPPPLSFHSCVAVSKKIVVFGGNSAEGQSSESFVLDTTSWSWSTVPSSLGAPAKRSSHTATIVHDYLMVVIGGRGQSETTQALGDVAVFDTSSGHWVIGTRVEGQLPPRYGHAAVAVGNQIVVFGGVGDQGQLLNDVWILNCEKPQTLSWSRAVIATPPAQPAGVAGHSMLESMSGIYCFGGRQDALGYAVTSDLVLLDSSAIAPVASGVQDGGRDDAGMGSPTPVAD
jgi:N-acetylneuraminic acid mutarotase